MADLPPVIARHLKKVIPLAHSRARLELAVAQELFSSAAIDAGTALLLRLLAEQPQVRTLSRVLDVGCGYGPLGLMLAAWNPAAEVHCVDRDALAVAFTAHNAARNDLANVTAYPSLGYDDVATREFDLVTSNIPAKAGPEVITALARDARHYLAPAGIAAVVAIDRIAPTVHAALTGPDFEVLHARTARGYTCVLYRATGPATPAPLPSFQRGDYDRDTVTVALGTQRLRLTTAWGLPEFDTVGYPTALAAAVLGERAVRDPVVYSPAQGHLPLLLAGLGARRVTLADRDLLALRVSERNLRRAGVAARIVLTADGAAERDRAAEPGGTASADGAVADCAVAVLRDPQAQATHLAAVEGLKAALDGPLVVAGASTAVTRVLDAASLQPVARRRRAGASAALAVIG